MLASTPQDSPVSPSPAHDAPFQDSHSHNTHTLFLEAVQANPHLSVSQIYKLLSFSGRKGNRIKDELVALGYIEVVEVRSDKGWTKHMKLTPVSTPALAE
jgi:hypothetical protein